MKTLQKSIASGFNILLAAFMINSQGLLFSQTVASGLELQKAIASDNFAGKTNATKTINIWLIYGDKKAYYKANVDYLIKSRASLIDNNPDLTNIPQGRYIYTIPLKDSGMTLSQMRCP